MIESEPELITIIEGPTPDFQPSPYLWLQSVMEGFEDAEINMCEMRTFNADSILERCRTAWNEGRPVKLDYPDRIRMRKQADVVALKLYDGEEGPLLIVWVRQPFSELREEGIDDEEDDFSY